MERLVCLLIGYIFGLFQTGYFYGKTQGVDIRKMGSGNAPLQHDATARAASKEAQKKPPIIRKRKA